MTDKMGRRGFIPANLLASAILLSALAGCHSEVKDKMIAAPELEPGQMSRVSLEHEMGVPWDSIAVLGPYDACKHLFERCGAFNGVGGHLMLVPFVNGVEGRRYVFLEIPSQYDDNASPVMTVIRRGKDVCYSNADGAYRILACD